MKTLDDVMVSFRAAKAAGDLDAMEMAFNKMQEFAGIDSLTNLPNRRAFDEELEKCQDNANRHGHLYLLLSIDMDNLKILNDTPGNGGSACGDAGIKACASAMKKACRKADFLARFGGDDFAGLFIIRNTEEADKVIEHLREAVERGFDFKGKWHSLGISIGHTVIREGTKPQELWEIAFANMKADKDRRKAGRPAAA